MSQTHQPIPLKTIQPSNSLSPLCPICNAVVPLENAKTDEHGTAIHEECYLLKVDLWRASGAA